MAGKSKIKASAVRKIFLCLIAVLIAVNELYYRFGTVPQIFSGELKELVFPSVTRLLGAAACIIFILEFDLGGVMKPLGNKKPIWYLSVIPALIIAVNNFPFVAFLSGNAPLTKSCGEIFAFAFFCISVGLFEELAFRGCGLVLLLQKMKKTRLGVFLAVVISSVVFGLVHFLNGAGAFLQVGYSMLIGALCGVVLLATENIWLSVLIHGLYNFSGSLMDMSMAWTKEQIIFTTVISLPVAVYMIWLFFKIPIENAQRLYENDSNI